MMPEVAGSADPAQAELGLARLAEAVPEAVDRLQASSSLLRTVVTVMAASPFLTRTCVTDSKALDVLAAPDQPVEPLEPLSRWKALEVLRVAALDLGGQISLETVGRLLADLADGVLISATGFRRPDRRAGGGGNGQARGTRAQLRQRHRRCAGGPG